MSGLIGSILSATNALKSNQLAIATAGKNMANVNNANYSRQRIEFGISGGISENLIVQIRDAIVDSKFVSESSVVGDLEVQNKILRQLQAIFGEQITDDVSSPNTLEGSTAGEGLSGGLSSAISDFFNAFQSLSANSDDTQTKAAVIAKAEVMVSRFNELAEDLEVLDKEVLRSIDVDVNNTNTLLKEIAKINGDIAKIEIKDPGGALELRDLRQQKLEELAQYIDFETKEVGGNGQIVVVAKDKGAGGGNDVLLVDRTNVPNQILFNESSNELYFSSSTTKPLGTSPNTTAFDVSGGSLHAYLDVRSTTDPYGGATSYATGSLSKMQEDLDTLAREIATQVSVLYDDLSDPLAPEIFFDNNDNPDAVVTANITAKNIQLYKGDPLGTYGTVIDPLNATTLKTTNTPNSGANELAVQIAELGDYTSSALGNNTFMEYISDIATNLGYELSSNNNQLENQELVMTQLQDQRASASGVSIDEELANIILFQRSFEASARVIKVLDEMLELVTTGLVR
jgi:flagellar hook-associated protein 1